MLSARAANSSAMLVGVALVLSACGGGAEGSANNADVVRVPANLCTALSAADIGQAIGRAVPEPQLTQKGFGEQDCKSAPASGNTVSFKMFWGDCVDGKPPNMDCLNSVSGAFATYKQQTISPIQPISGLGDQAFCIPAPFATVEVLKRWFILTVVADACPQAQKLAGTLLTKLGQ
jgi:hypothetical protein